MEEEIKRKMIESKINVCNELKKNTVAESISILCSIIIDYVIVQDNPEKALDGLISNLKNVYHERMKKESNYFEFLKKLFDI
jgi:ribulose 1,5-bisphosphate synthetase/thiazole synthase